MDHARKIGKKDLTFSWTEKRWPSSSVLRQTCGTIEAEKVTEDRRLVNWRKWLANREKHYRNYENNFGRDRKDLVMITDIDDVGDKIETNNLIRVMNERMSSTTGKDRGNPEFWITPESLPKRGNPDLPDIFVSLTRKQISVETTMERIVLPELIKREKGLALSGKQSVLGKAKDKFGQRDKKIRRKLKLLEARQLEMRQLALKGEGLKRIMRKRTRKSPFRMIKTMETFESEDESQSDGIEDNINDNEDNAIGLIVQGREITLNRSGGWRRKSYSKNCDYFTWSLTFNSTDCCPCKRQIILKNKRNFKIMYRWRRVSLGTSFVRPMQPESQFFFNKNKGIILPREIVKVAVWFRSRQPRIATEFWRLTTEPLISDRSLIFRFWGSTIFSNDSESKAIESNGPNNSANIESIDNYLNRRTRDTTVDEIMKLIMDNVEKNNNYPSVSYKSLFVEREIFRAKNSFYLYDSSLVKELRRIYEDATSERSPFWNLSLTDLGRVLSMMKDPKFRNVATARFNDSSRNLLKKNHDESVGDGKRWTVYNLLCCFANKFEAESDYVMSKCFEMEEPADRISREASGDITRWTSITSRRISLEKTPRKKSGKIDSVVGKSTTSRTSISTNNRQVTEIDSTEKKLMKKCGLYEQVLRVRIREILSNTIMAICAVIDTINNFNPA